ncbi:MAG: hypothetical protein GQ570_01220 [Helicobacteraceae bacterium]|nr:hypothetical protein [Helicobacteraceae bacterium]
MNLNDTIVNIEEERIKLQDKYKQLRKRYHPKSTLNESNEIQNKRGNTHVYFHYF